MKKLYIIFCIAVLSTSCDRDFLDIQPVGIVIPNNVEDYRLLLDQVDGNVPPPNFDQVAPDVVSPGFVPSYSNQDYMSDDVSFGGALENNFLAAARLNAYTFQDEFYEPNADDPDWNTLYGQIYVANIVVEDILNAEGGTDGEKLQLLAEAKLHRAFAYFALVNLYAVHYNTANAATTLAVPLRLTSERDGVDLSRASVETIYQFILDEVADSIDDLPDVSETSDLRHRPSKVGAYAFLARVYLYMGRYEQARTAANDALALNNSLTDYNTLPGGFLNTIRPPRSEDDSQLLWFKSSREPFRGMPIADELLAQYVTGDLRRGHFIPFFVFGIPSSGFNFFAPQSTGTRYTGFSTPEMYLIRAEANVRLNETAAAVDDLNTLRQNRFDGGTFQPITSTDPQEVLDLVKTERRLELFALGLRFFDLKRYNAFDNANITLTHTLDSSGDTFTLTPNSKNWAIPVARKYIALSPEIGENDRE